MDRFFRRAVGALLIVFAGSAGAEIQKAKPQFFAAPPAVAKSANAPDKKSQATPVRLNAREVLALRRLDEVQLNLPNGRVHDVVVDLVTPHGGDITSWVGRVKGHGNQYRVIMTTGPGGSFAAIDTPDGPFRIVPGDGNDWLVDMTAESTLAPEEHPHENDGLVPHHAPKSAEAIDLSRASYEIAIPGVNTVAEKATPTPQAVIDMMFVVTNGLANRLGNNLVTRLNFLVTRANTSYADSEIAMTMRMVHFTVVNYSDSIGDSQALNEISPGSSSFNAAVFGNIEALRTQFGADMVTFLRNNTSGGGSGVAWVPSSPSANLMYSTMQGCVDACEHVWIHEVGHNMGSFHDRATDSWQDGGAASQPGNNYGYTFCKSGALTCNPFLTNGTPGACSSSQPECSDGTGGSRNPSNFADIMSYFHGSATKLYRFSNSLLSNCVSTMAGNDGVLRSCGAAMPGTALIGDAAGTLNGNRAAISAMRTAPANLPGALQFSATGYSAAESAGTMTFTVSRVGGSSGAISVQYALTSGSATAGSDFTATGGTLNWANGDTANKTITVTLANDGIAESAESFTVTLSNPAGATGVYLGYPSVATGLILGDFGGTAGGALPAGFTSTDWTVANDQANDGTTSLRSAQVLGVDDGSFNNPRNSDLTYTGNIPAGVIAFAYRVSSYDGLGNFEFSVDGTTVLTDTGESGWKVFLYNLPSGGNHTLRWRYANRLPFRCNVANPPPTGGSNCADRVWIDSVSLPAAPVVTHALTVTKAGTGLGTVTSSPAGISCGATCAASYNAGTAVTLTAAPSAGSVFAGWSGSCSGTGTCQVTLAAATTVTATFTLSAGTPTGSASPSAVAFGGASMGTTTPGVAVTLTNIGTGTLTVSAVAVSNARFAQTNNCTALTSGASCVATVTFAPNAAVAFNANLTFTTSGGNVVVPLSGTGELSLVTHYYRAILNRAPDDSGKAFWNGEFARLGSLGANPNESWFLMANYFFNSAEYLAANKTNTNFMIDVYNTFFNRPPDQSGFDFWMSQMAAGLSREGVIFWFMFSNEFRTFTQGIFGNTAARPETDMVMDLFRGILNRFPETSALNAYVAGLRAAQCQPVAQRAGAVYTQINDMSYFFLFGSAEYSNRARSNAQFVSDMYNAFLRRGGTDDEVDFWINRLNTGASDRNTMRASFIASPEFGARVNAVIAAGCVT